MRTIASTTGRALPRPARRALVSRAHLLVRLAALCALLLYVLPLGPAPDGRRLDGGIGRLPGILSARSRDADAAAPLGPLSTDPAPGWALAVTSALACALAAPATARCAAVTEAGSAVRAPAPRRDRSRAPPGP